MRIVVVLLACALASTAATAAAAPPAAAPAAGSASAAGPGPTGCRKLPAGKRLVKLNLKPNTDIPDLVAWISSVTCKSFVLPSGLATGKTVTIVSPQLITVSEAYELFLDALDSVGLTVYREGRYLRVIEHWRAKIAPIPVVVVPSDEAPADNAGR